jgi:hypothetical protein
MIRLNVAAAAAFVLLAACSSGQMISYGPGSQKVVYSKYYDRGVWLEEGALGLQVVVDHGTRPNPNLVVATGTVTIYLVNLETKPRTIGDLLVSTSMKETSLPNPTAAVALPRARTKVPLGSVPIFDYATEVPLTIRYRLDDQPSTTKVITLPRIPEDELKAWGPGGRPPYPWFSAPYFPFDPPLRIVD